jgi:radical SAM superfamily enzyme YgiQ (UPF0313 family)
LSTYELGHQPLHLASPLAFLERAGFRPRAIDLAVSPLDEAWVAQAKLIAVAVPMHTALRLGGELLPRLRALNPEAHICYYGLYAPLNRQHLSALGANTIIGGEYETALVELAQNLESENRYSKPEIIIDRLDFPVPSRMHLPLAKNYAQLVTENGSRPAGYVEASRGCLHHCRHCPIPPVYEGRFFVVPVETVLADVAQQAPHVGHVTLGDADFFNGPKHAMKVARAIHENFPSLTFDVTIKVEHLLKHRALLPELRALGCAFVVSAVESLSNRVLEILDKGHTRADVETALSLLDDAELPLRPTWVPFTPWTSLADYLQMLDWIAAHRLIDHVDPVQLAIRLLIPPGSKLLSFPETQSVLGPLEPAKLSYVWRHPDARMDRLAHDVYVAVESGAEFSDVRALAYAAAAREVPPPPVEHEAKRVRARPPHLSESWFC